MSEYFEIENVKTIARYNRELADRLTSELPHRERRVIGYPQGTFEAAVRFQRNSADEEFWWAAHKDVSGEFVSNFFGRGTPSVKTVLNIDVQFNLPLRTFSRRRGGAFVGIAATGEVLLAHRGIVTLGHGRVAKAALFDEMAATLREVGGTNGAAELLLISELKSPTLVADIAAFSAELRRTVQLLGAAKSSAKRNASGKVKAAPPPPSTPIDLLKDYFDEFDGKKHVKGRKASVADCYHGTVVRALRDQFKTPDVAKKTRAIDLVAITSKKILLFEVKTSSSTQNVYTAIGQLLVHSDVASSSAPTLVLDRIIVLPERPSDQLFDVLTRQLKIQLLTFTRTAAGSITIHGLKNLL